MAIAPRSPAALRAPSNVKPRSRRCELPQRRPPPHQFGAHIDAVAVGEIGCLCDGAQESRPADRVIDGVMNIAVGFMRRDHSPAGAREGSQMILCAAQRRGRALGASALRLAGNPAHDPVKLDQHGVGQVGFQAERHRHERPAAAEATPPSGAEPL